MLETCSLRRRVQEGRADVPLLFSSRQDAPVFERGDRRPLMKQKRRKKHMLLPPFRRPGRITLPGGIRGRASVRCVSRGGDGVRGVRRDPHGHRDLTDAHANGAHASGIHHGRIRRVLESLLPWCLSSIPAPKARSCSWCASCAFNHPIVDDGQLVGGIGPQKREGRHAIAFRPSR